jgi:hypothetical protein
MISEIIINKNTKNNILGTSYNYNGDILKGDIDCYYYENNIKKLLFKVRKNIINDDEQNLLIKNIKSHSKKPNINRAKAAGGHRISSKSNNISSEMCRSNIIGYYDVPDRRIIKHMPSKIICRETSYNKNNHDKFNQMLHIFSKISNIYKELCIEHYNKQLNAISKIDDRFKILNTVFTTITCNYNFQTKCHRDKGDFKDGMGVLLILGTDNYKGGDIVFPDFDICVEVRPKDIIIMDVHQIHCNTPLEFDKDDFRLSLVFYLRENMLKCNDVFLYNNEYIPYYNKNI